MGMARILIEARDRKLIPRVNMLLDRFENEAGFWISSDLRRRILQLTGE